MLSRKPQKAVRSTDPGQSAWWLLPPACGTVVGATIPYLSTLGPKWAAACMALNAIGGLAATTPQFRERISARFHNQQITDTAGVLKNGISNKHISNDDLYSLRVHRSNRKDITDFVRRDIQDQLAEHLHNGKPILIEGPSMSGKTRLAIETIRSHWPDSPLWFPRDDDSIEKLLKNDQPPTPGAIVLLDDVDRFLSNQSLTLGQLNQWISNSCIIMATMMHSQYIKYSDRTNEKMTGWDVVNRLERLTLNPSLSATELNAAQFTSYADQLKQIKNIGLGPLLGCAEAVRTTFADELENHSWCGALIKAAADWRRFGLGVTTKMQLISFASTYRANSEEKADWDSIWSQATRPINGAVPLLKQAGEDKWEVIDIIADDNATWPLSINTLLELGRMNLPAHQLYQIATIIDQGTQLSPPPKYIFEEALKNNSNTASILGSYANYLGDTCRSVDDAFQAQTIYEQAVSADPSNARVAGDYAVFLDMIGDTNLASTMFEKAIELDPSNIFHLLYYAEVLGGTSGGTHRAQEMYERAIAADPKNANSLRSYARFLHQHDDEVKSQKMYDQANSIDPEGARKFYN